MNDNGDDIDHDDDDVDDIEILRRKRQEQVYQRFPRHTVKWTGNKIESENKKLNSVKHRFNKNGAGVVVSSSEVDLPDVNTKELTNSSCSNMHSYWNDPNELVDRLRLLIASKSAGHSGHNNEIISIIEELREHKIIE